MEFEETLAAKESEEPKTSDETETNKENGDPQSYSFYPTSIPGFPGMYPRYEGEKEREIICL